MTNLDGQSPETISVKLPPVRMPLYGEALVPMYTELFRDDVNLVNSLGILHARHAGEDSVRVLSIGCSVGAEPDSILSVYNRMAPGVKVAMRGIDINPLAIERASYGRYKTRTYALAEYGYLSAGAVLRNGGFKTVFRYDKKETTPSEVPSHAYLEVDSGPVREGHDVVFVNSNVKSQDPASADLVMINNILYHGEPKPAVTLLSNAARLVAVGGIISIGGNGGVTGCMKGPDRPPVPYNSWLARAGEMLVRDHGLKPLPVQLSDVRQVSSPTMFVRD
jgi:hypothetical protein